MRKPRNLCYFCGAPATSSEHVPPKQMFRRFPHHSIVVPSCDVHNSQKSHQDNVIIKAFLQMLELLRAVYPVPDSVGRAVELASSDFIQVRKDVKATQILTEYDRQLIHVSKSINFGNWIRQLTAGIVYSKLQSFDSTIDWDSTLVYSPHWISVKSPTPMNPNELFPILLQGQEFQRWADNLEWRHEYTARNYPTELYANSVYFGEKGVVMKHSFYSKFDWYVAFEPSVAAMSMLRFTD